MMSTVQTGTGHAPHQTRPTWHRSASVKELAKMFQQPGMGDTSPKAIKDPEPPKLEKQLSQPKLPPPLEVKEVQVKEVSPSDATEFAISMGPEETVSQQPHDLLMIPKDVASSAELKPSFSSYDEDFIHQDEMKDSVEVNALQQPPLVEKQDIERLKKEYKMQISQLSEEVEETKEKSHREIRELQCSLELEREERTKLMRENRVLERELKDLRSSGIEDEITEAAANNEVEKLREALRKTRALLADAQTALEQARSEAGMGSKSVVRKLKNRMDDITHARDTAVKARLTAESDLKEVQAQLEDVSRTRSELEQKLAHLQWERTSLLSRLSEQDEELESMLRRFKQAVQNTEVDRQLTGLQAQELAQVEAERDRLKFQVDELNSKLESMILREETSISAMEVKKLTSKIRQLESERDLEISQKNRFQGIVEKLQEQVGKLERDLELVKLNENTARESERRLARLLRISEEERSNLETRQAEYLLRIADLEKNLELKESENETLDSTLTLATKRIEQLRCAMVFVEESADSDSEAEANVGDLSPGSSDDEADNDGKPESSQKPNPDQGGQNEDKAIS